jgi:hypothetical protein
MRFVGALDAILALAVAWKLPGHFEKPTWHKPTNCRVDDNDIPNLECVTASVLAFPGRIPLANHLNSVDVILIGAHPAQRPDPPMQHDGPGLATKHRSDVGCR